MARYTPEVTYKWNNLDDIGAFLDLSRNPGESNQLYRQRILSVYIERAGANYDGLINGLNTEFGLSKYMGLRISCLTSNTPTIQATASSIILTANDQTSIVNYLYTKEDNYVYCKTLEEVLSDINSLPNWSASLSNNNLKKVKANTILIQSNEKYIKNFVVPATTRIDLEKTNIKYGSISSNEYNSIFKVEIPFNLTIDDPYSLLTEDGDYTVDYTNGVIFTFTTPSGYGLLNFKYIISPYKFVHSPCNVYSFEDVMFMNALYMQYSAVNKEYVESHDLKSYIRELFIAHNQTWGK